MVSKKHRKNTRHLRLSEYIISNARQKLYRVSNDISTLCAPYIQIHVVTTHNSDRDTSRKIEFQLGTASL